MGLFLNFSDYYLVLIDGRVVEETVSNIFCELMATEVDQQSKQ